MVRGYMMLALTLDKPMDANDPSCELDRMERK